MGDNVILSRRLSLAGHIHKIIPATVEQISQQLCTRPVIARYDCIINITVTTRPIATWYIRVKMGSLQWVQTEGLIQERRNSSVLAMELRLSYINPSKWNDSHHNAEMPHGIPLGRAAIMVEHGSLGEIHKRQSYLDTTGGIIRAVMEPHCIY